MKTKKWSKPWPRMSYVRLGERLCEWSKLRPRRGYDWLRELLWKWLPWELCLAAIVCRLCPVESDWLFQESSTRTAKRPKINTVRQKWQTNHKSALKCLMYCYRKALSQKRFIYWQKITKGFFRSLRTLCLKSLKPFFKTASGLWLTLKYSSYALACPEAAGETLGEPEATPVTLKPHNLRSHPGSHMTYFAVGATSSLLKNFP